MVDLLCPGCGNEEYAAHVEMYGRCGECGYPEEAP